MPSSTLCSSKGLTQTHKESRVHDHVRYTNNSQGRRPWSSDHPFRCLPGSQVDQSHCLVLVVGLVPSLDSSSSRSSRPRRRSPWFVVGGSMRKNIDYGKLKPAFKKRWLKALRT